MTIDANQNIHHKQIKFLTSPAQQKKNETPSIQIKPLQTQDGPENFQQINFPSYEKISSKDK